MKNYKRLLAILLCLGVLFSVAVISASAADNEVAEIAAEQEAILEEFRQEALDHGS